MEWYSLSSSSWPGGCNLDRSQCEDNAAIQPASGQTDVQQVKWPACQQGPHSECTKSCTPFVSWDVQIWLVWRVDAWLWLCLYFHSFSYCTPVSRRKRQYWTIVQTQDFVQCLRSVMCYSSTSRPRCCWHPEKAQRGKNVLIFSHVIKEEHFGNKVNYFHIWKICSVYQNV